jgi:ornithine decarboxylase
MTMVFSAVHKGVPYGMRALAGAYAPRIIGSLAAQATPAVVARPLATQAKRKLRSSDGLPAYMTTKLDCAPPAGHIHFGYLRGPRAGLTVAEIDAPLPRIHASSSSSFCLDENLSLDVGEEVIDATEMASVDELVQAHVDEGLHTGSFLVTNLAKVQEQFFQWKQELPMVEPFYAYKCNPDPAIAKLLARLGCGFDCASKTEIEFVLKGMGDDLSFQRRGKAASSIIYANPLKFEEHLEYAIGEGVRMTTFDGEDELYKIAKLEGGRDMELVLRLSTEDSSSVCSFSNKFGCPVTDAPRLLKIAQQLGLNVIGTSFHVGGGCRDPAVYTLAMDHCLQVFHTAQELGMPAMHLVDIGGGWPGDEGGYGGPGMPTFQDLARVCREAIKSFQANCNLPLGSVRYIAEPGRYFTSASTTIVTKVYGRKGGTGPQQAIYVDDGCYGSFNNVIYDHATPVPYKVGGSATDEELIPSSVFGPTCDGIDQMCDGEMLPRIATGDWLMWPNNGAYTHTASFEFNGYSHRPSRVYCTH